ncbi:MAG: ArnT family glycosyltransferase [Candidatus Promineifilaceae bacterium]
MVAEVMSPEKQAVRPMSAAAWRWLWMATAVLLLAAAMRLIQLGEIPPGLAQDEVLNADVAGFIRQGAHSLFFREGYGHEPLYHYWSVPFQVLLGDNVLSIRLPAAFLGILVVALTMRWVRRSFDLAAALTTGLLMAVSWWPIIFSRIGIRPIMEPFFLLLFAWFWPRRPLPAGLFLGLSLYTYTGARVIFLWPLLLALYWFLFRKHVPAPRAKLFGRSLPQPLLAAGIALIVALLVYLPLALTLRADPTLQQRVQQLEGPLRSLGTGDVWPILETSLATLGTFSFTGDPRWTYMMPGRPLFDPLTALFFYGGLVLALWRFKQPLYAFTLFWLLAGLLPSAITPQAPSTIRMIGALPAVYTLPALAVSWLWDRRSSALQAAWARVGIPLLLAGLFLLNLGLTLFNGFYEWPQSLETRISYQSTLVDIADYLKTHQVESPVFADGFYRPITADTLRRNLGYDPDGRWVQSGAEVAGAVVLPAEGNGTLIVPEYASPDASLMALAGVSGEPIYRSDNVPSFAVYELPENITLTGLDEAPSFDGYLSLVGYEITTPPDGQAIQLVTAWQVDGTLPDDLAIFVHWIEADGQLISQHDGFDAAPGTLRPGDIILQRHVLPWNDALQTSDRNLIVGLYFREDGRRVTISNDVGESADHITIPLNQEDDGG